MTAYVEPHPFQENTWCVMFTFPSGQKGMKGPFPSKASAMRWMKAMLKDPANQGEPKS